MTGSAEPADSAERFPTGTMKVGVIAERLGLSVRTLHYWEEVGLVTPSARSAGGFRLYTDADLERLILIRRMKPLGFTLEEMKAILEAVDTLNRPRAADLLVGGADDTRGGAERTIADCRQRVSERRAELQRLISWADEFDDLLTSNTLWTPAPRTTDGSAGQG